MKHNWQVGGETASLECLFTSFPFFHLEFYYLLAAFIPNVHVSVLKQTHTCEINSAREINSDVKKHLLSKDNYIYKSMPLMKTAS